MHLYVIIFIFLDIYWGYTCCYQPIQTPSHLRRRGNYNNSGIYKFERVNFQAYTYLIFKSCGCLNKLQKQVSKNSSSHNYFLLFNYRNRRSIIWKRKAPTHHIFSPSLMQLTNACWDMVDEFHKINVCLSGKNIVEKSKGVLF